MEEENSIPYQTVDPKSPIPLYYQIYLDLRRMIQDQIIPPGGMLPPEVEISQAYHVGRQTVRQAIARLVDENVLERFAGRGTFVKDTQHFTRFLLDRSFSQQIRELGMQPSSVMLSAEKGIIPAGIPSLLKWSGAPCLTLERLRLADNQPICHQTSFILTEKCPDLIKKDFAKTSLYEILSNDYHILVYQIDHRVRAVAADEYRAELLKVEKDSPLLFVSTNAYTEGGQLMEHTTSYYRADAYDFITSQEIYDD